MKRIFENPVRLIHEVYVWRIWFKTYRKSYPELEHGWDRKERNINTLIIQFYVLFFLATIIIGILMFTVGNYEIVKIVDRSVGIRT